MKRILLTIAMVAACGGGSPDPVAPVVMNPNTPQQAAAAQPAIAALQASKFDEARTLASGILASDGKSSRAAAVRAIVTYQAAGHDLIVKLTDIVDRGEHMKMFDHEAGRTTWKTFLDQLEAVDRDLAVASADPTFSLELCLACWSHDWNRNGEIDDRDRKLFELEYDGQGGVIDQTDERRRPTFRFDVGDVDWARAMVSFQRAAVEMILAYQWSELDKLFKWSLFGDNSKMEPIRIKLTNPGRVKHARELILAGVTFADRCRQAYLAETDDDREWVPNPTQKNHPIPMPMDASIYATWEAVTGDVRRMMRSEEGISLQQLVMAIDASSAPTMPDGYLDFGAMLRDPSDIVIDLGKEPNTKSEIEAFLRAVFGNGYRSSMKPSPMIGRLAKMKSELETGADTFDNKLRYLLWLN